MRSVSLPEPPELDQGGASTGTQRRGQRFTRRGFLTGAGVTGAALVALGLYSNEIARHELDVTHQDFPIRNLPPAFEGFRVAQFSDIHLDEYMEDFFLLQVIERVNQLQPDLVLVTGDFVSRGPLPATVPLAAAGRCAELLARLECPLRYGVLGNHDAMVGPRFIRQHTAANGLPLLVNEFVPIVRSGQHIYLGGLDDVSLGKPDVSMAVPAAPDAPVLLMCHEPDYADNIVANPRGRLVDLIFSGHTHGGQVRLPGLRPMALPPHGQIYVEGRFTLGSSHLYVNRGVGTVGLPFRLNCPPEITVATLRRAPSTNTAQRG